ncbi:MAG: hypothetical protein M3Q99_11940 [Acidobacteriota bacterium]|nr:hypothetical protein [Acidobacteriota bacterium]
MRLYHLFSRESVLQGSLVEAMLDAKKNSQAARTDKDKTFYRDRCNALDRQIDKSVYQLYDLTDDEIKIVEGAA